MNWVAKSRSRRTYAFAELRDVVLASLTPAKRSHGPTPSQVELKRVKRELARKEKALAETAALLVLSKKYRAIMRSLKSAVVPIDSRTW